MQNHFHFIKPLFADINNFVGGMCNTFEQVACMSVPLLIGLYTVLPCIPKLCKATSIACTIVIYLIFIVNPNVQILIFRGSEGEVLPSFAQLVMLRRATAEMPETLRFLFKISNNIQIIPPTKCCT